MKSLLSRARSLFRSYHGYDAGAAHDIVIVSLPKQPAVYIGEVIGILYRNPEGKAYKHLFGKSRHPLLYVTSDGRTICITKGGYRFTSRGFVG